ncbi:HAD family hydrolase [Youxingia wuxianensis]|nr:HAD hydrolase-like protein [Youxingia wuxianensis]
MKYQVILWDMDGTLIDTSAGLFQSLKQAFLGLGMPEPSPELLKIFIGPPVSYIFKNYIGADEQTTQKAVQLFRSDYQASGIYNSVVYEGLVPLIEKMRENKMLIGVATLKPDSSAKWLLDYLKIDHLIDACQGSDDIKNITKAQTIEHCLERLGVSDKSKVVLIGDTSVDAAGAKEAGVDFIGVEYGCGGLKKAEKEKLGAAYIAADIADLEKFIFE